MQGSSMLRVTWLGVLLVVSAASCGREGSEAATEAATNDVPADAPGTIIVNAQIADGSGTPLYRAAVRLRGDRIVGIGDLEADGQERVIDAAGRVLAPGFIDMHNHSDDMLPDRPLAESQVSQGITTIVVGADGGSPWPIGSWLDARRQQPAAVNVVLLAGHGTIRHQVMDEDYERPATAEEVERMVALVDESMRAGAAGLSSGLEYEIASYSETGEVVAMARAAARHGGFYMTHVRDEADRSFEALQEAIAIGKEANVPVQHSHIKLATVNVWNRAGDYIELIERARSEGVDYLADIYPYDAWNSTIKVLVPNKQYEDPESVARALADVGGADRVTITEFPPNPAYETRDIAELAEAAGVTPVEMYIRIIQEGEAAGSDAGVIGQSMLEADIKAFLQRPWVMIASDGGIDGRHPRGAGTFPRVLGKYVREAGWLTLPDAIHKMTALPARRLGWEDRGVIREGAYADLVLFDPDSVADRATFEDPLALSVGIDVVFVNGTIVWETAKTTGARPGRVLP